MAFRSDTAAATLSSVLDELARTWERMPPELQATLDTLIRTHGPQIADRAYDRFNVLSRITALLDALWQLQARLPVQAVRILQAGQATEASFRGITSVPDAVRVELLQKMVPIADFRVFDDPRRAAAEVDELISRHQDRLRTETGANGQASEHVQWQACHATLIAGGAPADYLRKVEALLGEYPAVRQLIETHKLWAPGPTMRHGTDLGMSKGIPEVSFDQGLASATSPAVMTRYANVNFPNRVLLTEKRVTLLIQVTRELQDWGSTSAEESRISVQLGNLTIVVTAEDFALVDALGGDAVAGVKNAREVKVAPDRDCDPVAFLLTPQSAGSKKIQIDFYQFNRNISTLSLQTEVTADPGDLKDLADVEIKPQSMQSPALGDRAPIPDLELRIIMSADRTKLFYLLHSAQTRDYNFKAVGQVDLGTDPQTFLKPTFDKLSTLARLSNELRTADQTQSILQELDDIGVNLYSQLFPADLKAEYRTKIRTAYKQKGLLITSDEPWIPWEMVKPYESDESGNEVVNDPPLCVTFQMSRWLAGRGAPDRLRMQRGVWVAPPDNLQAAQKETDYFMGLKQTLWSLTLDGPLSTVADVDERFRGGSTEHYHFACHGNFNTDDPNESKLKLAGDFLRPSQIAGPKQAGLRKSKPLVFVNACYGGRVGVGLTQLGGWAQKFLDSGASAFIGSLWEINDVLAARFAQEFYDRLWGVGAFEGKAQPLGQAFSEARLVIRDADPANPTWLAYVLYGDPYGQVILGDAVPA